MTVDDLADVISTSKKETKSEVVEDDYTSKLIITKGLPYRPVFDNLDTIAFDIQSNLIVQEDGGIKIGGVNISNRNN